MIIWKPLAGECLQWVKESPSKMDKNTVAMVCINSYSKKEVVGHVKQKLQNIV